MRLPLRQHHRNFPPPPPPPPPPPFVHGTCQTTVLLTPGSANCCLSVCQAVMLTYGTRARSSRRQLAQSVFAQPNFNYILDRSVIAANLRSVSARSRTGAQRKKRQLDRARDLSSQTRRASDFSPRAIGNLGQLAWSRPTQLCRNHSPSLLVANW